MNAVIRRAARPGHQGRQQVEPLVHVEAEGAVRVDVRPEQRSQSSSDSFFAQAGSARTSSHSLGDCTSDGYGSTIQNYCTLVISQPDLSLCEITGIISDRELAGGNGSYWLNTPDVRSGTKVLVIPFEGLSQAESWVSTGANEPLAQEQVAEVLGQEDLTTLAKALGIPASEVSAGLAEKIPAVVDGASPDGKPAVASERPPAADLGSGQIVIVKVA
ncbi:YidB family protein [Streptomyces sp. NPDC058412]|uniref:YidB family protein n=1 Tax=Streptomyces sp. NPDC058412 TaxID=3346486 RepID=UPI003665E3FA